MKRWLVWGIAWVAVGVLGGCNRDSGTSDAGKSDEPKPRHVGQFSDTAGRSTAAGAAGTAHPVETRPAATMPDDAVHAGLAPDAGMAPRFNPPADWQPRPARGMTDRVFVLARAEGDPEDADLALSHLEQHVAMQGPAGNLARWTGMFGYSGPAIEQNAKVRELEGVKLAITLVDISGTYRGSMMAPSSPKENYRMLVAEIRTPQRPYYVRLVGPQRTVAKWEESFMMFVREAAK